MAKKPGSKVHKDIKGFDIIINPFGELKSSFNIDDLNTFLDKHVPDKKVGDPSPQKTIENLSEEE